MPKAKTAYRLAQAIGKLKLRIEDYIKKVASSNVQSGCCIIVPTHTGVPEPTLEQIKALTADVLERYQSENLSIIAIRYFIPPCLSSSKIEGFPDYEIIAGITEFDEDWQTDQHAQALLSVESIK